MKLLLNSIRDPCLLFTLLVSLIVQPFLAQYMGAIYAYAGGLHRLNIVLFWKVVVGAY